MQLPRPFLEGEKSPTNHAGILGATSLVGTCLLPLLLKAGWHVTAYSRHEVRQTCHGVEWRLLPPLPSTHRHVGEASISFWVCAAPIWVLPDYFPLLEELGAQRLVVLSSTSRFTKYDSTDPEEQAVANRLAEAEVRVQKWAESRGVELVILRPTLIYGLGRDKNVAEIARFIQRFGFFPLLGRANGLRQPIHVVDVASVCFTALQAPCAANRTYNISGAETLAYHRMIARIFAVLGRRPRLLSVPLWVFSLAMGILRRLPRYRLWSTTMAERMNRDLVFDHTEATRDLGFNPRAFVMSADDVPR